MSATYVMDFEDVTGEDDLKGGGNAPAEGQYHFVITNVNNTRDKVDALVVELEVLAGTIEGQKGKKFNENFWEPNTSHKDGGKFAKGKLAKLILATGLATREELFGKRVQINWDDLVFRTLKGSVIHRKSKGKDKNGNEREYDNCQLDGLDFCGPCDADGAHIPVDQEALDLAFEAGQLNAKPSGEAGAAASTPAKDAANQAPDRREAEQKKAAADPYAALG